MSSALRVSRYALYTYDWPSRTPRKRRGRSRPILGSATLTTVESRKTIPDPSTAAIKIQRLVLTSLSEIAPTQDVFQPQRAGEDRRRTPTRRSRTINATASGSSLAIGGAPLL